MNRKNVKKDDFYAYTYTIAGFTRRFVNKKHMRSVMEFFMADLAFELKKRKKVFTSKPTF